jgi:glycosyltransferase involved in cell wall biosynthesis
VIADSLISILIPTCNSAKTLSKCLESIGNQTHKEIEVIVVDNYSIDETREIAENFGARVVLYRSSRSKARNIGASLAQGKFILSLDSDMELTPKVVEACLDAVKNDERVGGVILPERSLGNSFWGKVRRFERSFYTNTQVESARFFRKDLVDRVNGFDEDIVYFEESTLPQKIKCLGFNVNIRVCNEILHHEDNFSLWNWLKKKLYYGKSSFKYRERYGEHACKQMNISYRLLIFLKDKRFYSNPMLALGVITLKTLEYFSTRLGYLASK